MGLVEVKTAELVGSALDWAVATALGAHAAANGSSEIWGNKIWCVPGFENMRWDDWTPTRDWAQGGTLRDKYDAGIEPDVPDGLRYAYVPGRDLDGSFGETALIALCRVIVATELGDVVQVPAELVGVGV